MTASPFQASHRNPEQTRRMSVSIYHTRSEQRRLTSCWSGVEVGERETAGSGRAYNVLARGWAGDKKCIREATEHR